MKKQTSFRLSLIVVLSLGMIAAAGFRQGEPWKADQLMAAADLAALINSPTANKPLIVCVGPSATIKGSVEIGPANKAGNLDKLKELLQKENRKEVIVIYCGCCPFKNCPNIRPAFTLLNEMGFTNHKLLDIPHNIKVDWLDRHYPSNSIQ
jgi:hypothetical protein